MDNALPPLYAGWVQQLVGAAFSGEPRSTCSDCSMSRPQELPTPLDFQFHPNVKCCTFTPGLPNYLVGAILLDDDPTFAEGRERFERRAPLLSVGPLGIGPTDVYRIFYTFKPFGKQETLACPYFIPRDGGLCGIWQHRNATCATWFCTSERGQTGYNFWHAMRVFLREVEKELALWCIRRLNLIVPEIPSGPQESIWGNWSGREREFYQECYRAVSGLSAAEIVDLAGSKATGLLEEFRNAVSAMREDVVPERLVLFPCRTWSLGNGFTRVWSYSEYDALDLSDETLSALSAFDGRSTHQVVAEIQAKTGLCISRVLLQKLVDTRILVDPMRGRPQGPPPHPPTQ